MKLEGKVAIIAGGGQGIGEGIVRCLAEEGSDIAVVDINGDAAGQTAREVEAQGRRALAVVADLTDENQVRKAVKDIVEFFGKIDILVNSVGGTSHDTGRRTAEYAASLEDSASLPAYMRYSPDIWDRYYELNLKSHVMLSQAVTPYFVRQRSGKIVNISSDAGRMAEPNLMPYAAMKAGDISLTWSLARALAPYNITVNCVCPGFVFTPLWARGAAGLLETARAAGNMDVEGMTPKDFWLKYMVLPSTPMGREQTAEDMGRAVVFFLSEDARNITGQVLHVDGGMVMR